MSKTKLSLSGFAHLFLLIVIVAIGIGGILFYSWKGGLITTTPNQEISSLSTPTPNLTSDWQTYTNEELGFLVKHPTHLNPIESYNQFRKDVVFASTDFTSTNGKHHFDQFRISTENTSFEEQVNFVRTIVAKDAFSFKSEAEIEVDGKKGTRLNYASINASNSEEDISRAIFSKGEIVFTIYSSSKMLNPILSTFKFLDSSLTQSGALEKIKELPEVAEFLINTPNSRIEINQSDTNSKWLIHVYEAKDDHNATFNWYEIDKTSGIVKKVF